MDKIICLVGASGSGKTATAKELEKEGYNIIQSFTTRKPRQVDEWGHTFIKEVTLKRLNIHGKLLEIFWKDLDESLNSSQEVIAYFQAYGEIEYFATREQYRGKGVSVYVVDPKGAEQVKKNVDDAQVITIFLNASESVRFSRVFRRARDSYIGNGDKLVYADNEAQNRVFCDNDIFKVCKCDYIVDTESAEIKDVVSIIREIVENE